MTLRISKQNPDLYAMAGTDIEAELSSGLCQFVSKVLRGGRVIYRRTCRTRAEAEADAAAVLPLFES